MVPGIREYDHRRIESVERLNWVVAIMGIGLCVALFRTLSIKHDIDALNSDMRKLVEELNTFKQPLEVQNINELYSDDNVHDMYEFLINHICNTSIIQEVIALVGDLHSLPTSKIQIVHHFANIRVPSSVILSFYAYHRKCWPDTMSVFDTAKRTYSCKKNTQSACVRGLADYNDKVPFSYRGKFEYYGDHTQPQAFYYNITVM